MVFFGWGLALPAASTGRIASLALATCFGVEVLKLWQSPWWVHVRHTTAGHLVFGHAFSWQNPIWYTLGVALGVAVEWVTRPAPGRHWGKTGSLMGVLRRARKPWPLSPLPMNYDGPV